MGLIDTFREKLSASRAEALARTAEAQARAAEAQARAEVANTQAEQAKLTRGILAGDVDPVAERENRLIEWQKNHQARIRKCRTLYETDPIASVVVNRIVENEIGAGPELECNTGDAALNSQVETLWYSWIDNAEATGLGWGEFCQLSKIHEMVDGDVAAVLLNDTEQVQLIGADQIRGDGTTDGIIADAIGRVTGYRIQSGSEAVTYPSNSVIFLPRRKQLRDAMGNRIHRGTSVFSANYELYSKATQWRNAEVRAAIVAAKLVFVMTKNNAAQWNNGQPTDATTGEKTFDLSNADKGLVLEPGEDIKQLQGTHPTSNFSEPFRLLIRELGAETGLPLEMLILDFSQGNFSSTKTALLFTQRAFIQRQAQFATRYLLPIYRWRISRWIASRQLPADPKLYTAARFIFPRWPVLDPMRDAMAEMLQRDMGNRTFGDWCNENGIDPDEQVQRLAQWANRFRAAGLPLYHSSSAVPIEAVADPSITAADMNLAQQMQ